MTLEKYVAKDVPKIFKIGKEIPWLPRGVRLWILTEQSIKCQTTKPEFGFFFLFFFFWSFFFRCWTFMKKVKKAVLVIICECSGKSQRKLLNLSAIRSTFRKAKKRFDICGRCSKSTTLQDDSWNYTWNISVKVIIRNKSMLYFILILPSILATFTS